MDSRLFASTASYYSRFRVPYPDELLSRVRNAANLTGHGHLLDLGCGTGEIAMRMSPYFNAVTAVDVEQEILQEAHIGATKVGCNDIQWRLCRAEEFESPSQTFELVTIGAAFHWMDRSVVARRCRGRLAERGHPLVILGSNSIWTGSADWQEIVRGVIRKWLGDVRRAGGGHFKNSSERHEAILQTEGFEIEEHTSQVTHTWTLDELIGYIHSTSFGSHAVLGNIASPHSNPICVTPCSRMTNRERTPKSWFSTLFTAHFKDMSRNQSPPTDWIDREHAPCHLLFVKVASHEFSKCLKGICSLRFSLKTFLVIVMILGMMMGRVTNKVRQQRNAVNAILAAGGTVGFDYQYANPSGIGPRNQLAMPPGPAWLRRILGDELFRTPVVLTLQGESTTDEFLANQLGQFPELNLLSIKCSNVGDAALPHIASFDLMRLRLDCPKITPAGIQQLKNLPALIVVESYRDPRNANLTHKLDEMTSIEMKDCDLYVLTEYLPDLHKIGFRIDDCVSRDQRNAELTTTQKNVTLGNALKTILEPLIRICAGQGSYPVDDAREGKTAHAGADAFRATQPQLKQLSTDW